MPNSALTPYFDKLLLLHNHICPRQVLGLRMALYTAKLLDLQLPITDKSLIAFVETDGCFADGVSVASGCSLGHRTLYLMDLGKTAVTFVPVGGCRAIRLAPRPEIRSLATQYAPDERSRWHKMLEGYQQIADEDLFAIHRVELNFSINRLISRAGVRATCDCCGEEIINEREVIREGRTLCGSCAGACYYEIVDEKSAEPHHEVLVT